MDQTVFADGSDAELVISDGEEGVIMVLTDSDGNSVQVEMLPSDLLIAGHKLVGLALQRGAIPRE
jgi:hypothetical protein